MTIKTYSLLFILVVFCAESAPAQVQIADQTASERRFTVIAPEAKSHAEVLTNAAIIGMTKAGLSKQIILRKIAASAGNYDVTADALINLKKMDVDDEVITAMMEVVSKTSKQNFNPPLGPDAPPTTKTDPTKTAAQLLPVARTIMFVKGSVYPSLKEVEGSLMSRNRLSR